MNNFDFPNNNTIVNFANSILQHFGAPTHHNTIPEVDEVLKGHKKVVVMLFDALGTAVRKCHLKDSSYLQKNFIHRMTATFPPTTVASTNGCLSGKYPIENGWMGWRQYYDDLKCNILVFKSLDPDADVYYDSPCGNLHSEKFGYKNINVQINEANSSVVVGSVFPRPVDKNGPKNYFGYRKRVNKFLKDKENCLMYVYDTQPDAYLHDYGVRSKKAGRKIKRIDRLVGRLAKDNPDTLFLVIADHGMIDVKTLWIFEHQDLVDTFEHQPSLEGRTSAFFIKNKEKEKFVELFNKYYGDKFTLITSEEAVNIHMFGEGKVNKAAIKFLGDYLAIATKEYCFDLRKIQDPKFGFKAHHAGYTKEEMEIDISALNV